jgi:hypothetical protein
VIVKIHWRVRLRLFFAGGKDCVIERPFQLGGIHKGQAVLA